MPSYILLVRSIPSSIFSMPSLSQLSNPSHLSFSSLLFCISSSSSVLYFPSFIYPRLLSSTSFTYISYPFCFYLLSSSLSSIPSSLSLHSSTLYFSSFYFHSKPSSSLSSHSHPLLSFDLLTSVCLFSSLKFLFLSPFLFSFPLPLLLLLFLSSTKMSFPFLSLDGYIY